MAKLICVDPGKTTGYAIFHLDSERQYAELLSVSQAMGLEWISTLSLSENDIFVYENYFIRGPQFDASGVEVIGAVKYASIINKLQCIRQEPSVPNFIRRRFYSDKQPKMPVHGRDAFYHGVFYLRQKGWRLSLHGSK